MIDVGLVGAGPWAATILGPVLAVGPETRLAGVWARRPDRAAALAASLRTRAFADYDHLLSRCDAVAFAVPPAVQAVMALAAARAGRALLLEKPLAVDLTDAERLADEVARRGIPTLVDLTWRYCAPISRFIADVRDAGPLVARAHYLSSTATAPDGSGSWRREHGAILDVGPHVIDLLDAALGPVVDVDARGIPGWCLLQLTHRSGAMSSVCLSGEAPVDPDESAVVVHAKRGTFHLDPQRELGPAVFGRLRRELAATVTAGNEHPMGVHRALHVQRVIESARGRLLAGAGSVD